MFMFIQQAIAGKTRSGEKGAEDMALEVNEPTRSSEKDMGVYMHVYMRRESRDPVCNCMTLNP